MDVEEESTEGGGERETTCGAGWGGESKCGHDNMHYILHVWLCGRLFGQEKRGTRE